MEGSRKEVKGEMWPNEQRTGTDTNYQDENANFQRTQTGFLTRWKYAWPPLLWALPSPPGF